MAAIDFKALRNILDTGTFSQFRSTFKTQLNKNLNTGGVNENLASTQISNLELGNLTKFVSGDLDIDLLTSNLQASITTGSGEQGSISFLDDILSQSGVGQFDSLTAAANQQTDRIDIEKLTGIEDNTDFRKELSSQLGSIFGRFDSSRLGSTFTGDARFEGNAEGELLKNLSSDILTLQGSRESPDLGLSSIRSDLDISLQGGGFSDKTLNFLKGGGENEAQFSNRLFRELDLRSPFEQVTAGSPVLAERGRRSPLGLLKRTDDSSIFGVGATLGQPTIFGE